MSDSFCAQNNSIYLMELNKKIKKRGRRRKSKGNIAINSIRSFTYNVLVGGSTEPISFSCMKEEGNVFGKVEKSLCILD
jgi:hypothetical protein